MDIMVYFARAHAADLRFFLRRQWASHHGEQRVKNLLAIGIVGKLGHQVNALQNRLFHKVVCGHEPSEPPDNLKKHEVWSKCGQVCVWYLQ